MDNRVTYNPTSRFIKVVTEAEPVTLLFIFVLILLVLDLWITPIKEFLETNFVKTNSNTRILRWILLAIIATIVLLFVLHLTHQHLENISNIDV